MTTRIICYLLILSTVTFSTGCAATLGSAHQSKAPVEKAAAPMPQSAEGQSQEAYIEMLKNKPPEELTEREIAYLQMVHQEKQAKSLRALTVMSGISLLGGLTGALVLVLAE